eukprot:767218-Hanusia_phi.AAC.3
MSRSTQSPVVSLLLLCISTALASFYGPASLPQPQAVSSQLPSPLPSRLRGGSGSLPPPANASGWWEEERGHAAMQDEDPTESDGKQRASIVYEGIRPSISLRDAWHSPSTEHSAALDPQVQLKWHNQLMNEAKQLGKLQDHRLKESRSAAAARFDSGESFESELQHSSGLRMRSEELERSQESFGGRRARRQRSVQEGATTILRFKVDVLGLQEGEEVMVVGNHGKLGTWDPDNGLILSSEGERTEWRGEVELELPGDLVAYEYKYVIRSGKQYRWEVKIPNRKLTIPSDFFGMVVVVQDGTFNMLSSSRVLLPQPREDLYEEEDEEEEGERGEDGDVAAAEDQRRAGFQGEGIRPQESLETMSSHPVEKQEEAVEEEVAGAQGTAAVEEQDVAGGGGKEADEKTLLQRELEVTRSKLSLMLSMVDSLQDARKLLVAKSVEIDSLKAQLARERGEDTSGRAEEEQEGERRTEAVAVGPQVQEARMLLRDQKEEIDILEEKLQAVELERDKHLNETKTLRAQIELLTEALCQAEEDQQLLNAELEKEIAQSRRLRTESEEKMKELKEDAEEAQASRAEAIRLETATGQGLQERLKELEGTESELRAEVRGEDELGKL